jgi:hypothetical protein
MQGSSFKLRNKLDRYISRTAIKSYAAVLICLVLEALTEVIALLDKGNNTLLRFY